MATWLNAATSIFQDPLALWWFLPIPIIWVGAGLGWLYLTFIR
jgi:hypothetical protein